MPIHGTYSKEFKHRRFRSINECVICANPFGQILPENSSIYAKLKRLEFTCHYAATPIGNEGPVPDHFPTVSYHLEFRRFFESCSALTMLHLDVPWLAFRRYLDIGKKLVAASDPPSSVRLNDSYLKQNSFLPHLQHLSIRIMYIWALDRMFKSHIYMTLTDL